MTERSPDRPSAKSSARTSARDLVARATSLDGVTAEPAELEIRSGIGIIIRDPMKRGVPAETQAEIQASLDNGIIIDRFIAEWGFDVSHEKAKDFHAWLVVNEKQIKLYCPAGVHYRGTYAVAAGDRQKTGRYRTIWGFASFSDMQLLAEQLGDETSALRRVIDEFNLYRDRSSHAAEVEWIMVPAAGALRL
jgi:hypothetical protein